MTMANIWGIKLNGWKMFAWCLGAVFIGATHHLASAGDWPQWLGTTSAGSD